MTIFETKYLYWVLLLFTLLGPILYSFERKVHFYSHWGRVILSSLVMMALFIPWDIIFTRMNVWGFSHSYTLGLFILDLPIEEWLFFIAIPFACVFVYEILRYYLPTLRPNWAILTVLLVAFAMLFLTLTITFFGRLYTFYASALAIVWVLWLLIKRPYWTAHFLLMFVLIMIPFILVNGTLTGMATATPVVSYNAAHIMGPRLITIPLEDTIYNFDMLIMTVATFEWLKAKKSQS